MPRISAEEWTRRFWARVDKSRDCWNWTGGKNSDGYGRTSLRGRTDGVHRISWVMHYGPIAGSLVVCHSCDNPSCVRPDHRFLGTQLDNLRDAAGKGRMVGRVSVGVCRNGHPRTPDNIITRKNARTPSGLEHVCRLCTLAGYRRYRKSKTRRGVTAAPGMGSIRRDCAASAPNHIRAAQD
jgi:hypothetical protein